MTRCIQLESRIFPGFDSDWKVIYGVVTLVSSTSRPSSISNCKSNFCFSVLSSIWRTSSKTKSARVFDLFQNKLCQSTRTLHGHGPIVSQVKTCLSRTDCGLIWEWKFQNRLLNVSSVFRFGSRSSKTNS